MITEKELICRSELLLILKVAKQKNRVLSKEQIIFLHYLANNQDKIRSELNKLKRMNFFSSCDYDENITRLILLGLVLQEIRNESFIYLITEKGLEYVNKLNSKYLLNKNYEIESLFKSPTNEKELREKILPMVKL